MKPPSSKFANLGPPGIARQFTKGGDANPQHEPTRPHNAKPDVSPSKPASGDNSEDRVAKWRKANKELYLERQKEYMRKRRAKN